MLKIEARETHQQGEVWRLSSDMRTKMRLAYLYQELHLMKVDNLQKDSDLDLDSLPLYACKVPTAMFFPYITYHCGAWFTNPVNFIVPINYLNRLNGKYWLDNLALSPAHIVNPEYANSKYRWGMIEPNGTIKPENTYSHSEIISLASSTKTYFLDDIRYVYDENKSVQDSSKSSEPSRHCFSEQTAIFDNTKQYLEWYVETFNRFFSNLIEFGMQHVKGDKEKRTLFLLAGWTINRIAIDTLTISLTDAPYLRKWQFFGMLDALANLISLLTIERPKQEDDAIKFKELLTRSYFDNEIQPALVQIPVRAIRDEVIAHTKDVYGLIEEMGMKNRNESGQDILRAYRNSRHGYALKPKERAMLINHNGKIPDNIPDLSIALWHYLLLNFPFK
jgi:hypothetical protein